MRLSGTDRLTKWVTISLIRISIFFARFFMARIQLIFVLKSVCGHFQLSHDVQSVSFGRLTLPLCVTKKLRMLSRLGFSHITAPMLWHEKIVINNFGGTQKVIFQTAEQRVGIYPIYIALSFIKIFSKIQQAQIDHKLNVRFI